MYNLEEYYLITSFQELAKKRADFISKIRSLSAMLKPRSYQVEQVLDNNGSKLVIRIPEYNIPEIKYAEGQYLEALSVTHYWIIKLNLELELSNYQEFKQFLLFKESRWEELAVNKMITRLKEHFAKKPLMVKR
eukprot:NODE_286_length_11757_cov_0.187768.p9 type:complete len:134 gc:universal NODE_286_length_11757_cov_0.187768:7132-6731(-)